MLSPGGRAVEPNSDTGRPTDRSTLTITTRKRTMSHFRLGAAVLFGAALVSLQVPAVAGSGIAGPTVKVPLTPQQKLPAQQVKPIKLPCTRPRLDGIRPYQGYAGTTLTLTGRCFGPASNRHVVSLNQSLGGSRPPILQVRSWSDTRIVGVIPRSASPGYYDVYVHVWYNGHKRSSNHRNFRISRHGGTANATPKGAAAAHLKPGLANQRPSGLPQVQPRPLTRRCPDLVPKLRIGWPARHPDGSYIFKILMQAHNRGNGPFVSNRRQVRLNLYEGSRLLKSEVIPSRSFRQVTLNPGADSSAVVYTIEHWYKSGEFSASYKAMLVYDPDIRMDGNPQNDDCVMTNNTTFLRAAQIRHTLETNNVPTASR